MRAGILPLQSEMSSALIYYGIILVLLVTVIAYFSWRSRGTEHFSLSTPATPRVREAVADLFVAMKHMVTLGRSFEGKAGARPDLEGARRGVAQITKALDRSEKELSGAPPTYVNYLAIYRGLTSTDRTLLSASDAYISAGFDLHQKMVMGTSPEEVELGNSLMAVGRQLRRVVAAVHRLGVALDVE